MTGSDVAEWANFGIVAGTAAATLTGLLFVAVTLRIESIVSTSDLRYRAAQTLTLFITVLILSMLLVIPRQALPALGVEIIVVAAAAGTALAVFDHRASRATRPNSLARTIDIVSLTLTAVTLVAVSGVACAAGREWGLYVLVPGVIAALVSGVVNAWLVLVRPPSG
ncbi:hypothetical protein [Catellatospora paridis]|uniref:hypothetical protein n=1 Tax=Catellatospora paridis TaxID=1617086 RepID=UPI0012D48232|nr:hypothetical protein [Catellatospora paridis]